MDKEHEDKLAEDNRLKGPKTHMEFPTLNFPPPTLITSEHFPSQELGITTE